MSYGIVGVPYDDFMVTFHPQCTYMLNISAQILDTLIYKDGPRSVSKLNPFFLILMYLRARTVN